MKGVLLLFSPTLSFVFVFTHPTDSPLIIFCPHLSFYPQMCTLTKTSAAAAAKLLQLCPTLWEPIDDSSPISSVPGILQARILEWVAISFSALRPLPSPNSDHLNVYIHTSTFFSFDLYSLGSFHHSNLTKNIASLKSCLCIQAEVLTLIK